MEYFVDEKRIVLNRELSKLDKFVLDFVNIISKYTKYVLISGYVSILLGRSRATEDIDIFIEKISKERFREMYLELVEKGFFCLNSDNVEVVFDYINDNLAIRFAKGSPIPNIEVKFPKDNLDKGVFDDFIIVELPFEKELNISNLEKQIAFKRYFLGSNKDFEDALHLEELFKDQLNYEKIKKTQEFIKNRGFYDGKEIS